LDLAGAGGSADDSVVGRICRCGQGVTPAVNTFNKQGTRNCNVVCNEPLHMVLWDRSQRRLSPYDIRDPASRRISAFCENRRSLNMIEDAKVKFKLDSALAHGVAPFPRLI